MSSGGGWAGSTRDRLLPELAADVGAEAARARTLISRAVPWATRTLTDALADPGPFLDSTAAVLAAVRTAALAAMGPASPVLADRSAGVMLHPIDVELDGLKRTARRWDATVNDVFLAGLLEGLARYHTKHGRSAASLRMGLPISSRSSEAELQNQFFGAVIRAPLGRLDFEQRVRLVHEIVRHGRNQPWAELMEDGAALAVRLPGAVAAVARGLASLDVLASNVMGSPVPLWLGDRQVVAMTPVGPRSGAAVNATLLSYCGSAHIGLNIDPAAVAEPHVLVDCLRSAFDDGLT